jgi:hypothetical protein
MVQIDIKLSNGLDIQVISILRPTDIEATLPEIVAALHRTFDHHVEQVLYQRTYRIPDDAIVVDFNGDALLIAMGIRMQDEYEMMATCGLSPELYTRMQEGRVKPSVQHLEAIAQWLRFPVHFFTSNIEYHTPQFTCHFQP